MDEVRLYFGERRLRETGKARDVSTDSRALGGDGYQAWITHGDDDDIGAEVFRPFAHIPDEVGALGRRRGPGPEAKGRGETGGTTARHHLCAQGRGQRAVDEADGARPNDKDARTGPDGQAARGPQTARKGLGQGEERGSDLAFSWGDACQCVPRHVDEVCEPAVNPGSK